MFGSRETRSFYMSAIRKDMPVTHVVGTGAGIVSAYSATKFAIRGLTQAAGMPLTELRSTFMS
jgi:hypothetical protein